MQCCFQCEKPGFVCKCVVFCTVVGLSVKLLFNEACLLILILLVVLTIMYTKDGMNLECHLNFLIEYARNFEYEADLNVYSLECVQP